MKILVVGATGATGRLLVEALLQRGHSVRAIVRDAAQVPVQLRAQENLELVEANLCDLSEEALIREVEGCDGIASCLGHNLTFRGLFGPPRRLVAESARRLGGAAAAIQPETPVRFVLMNSSGVRNSDLDEQVSAAQRFVLFLLRHLVPPHADNEAAAGVLLREIGHESRFIEWVAVRPDSLVDESAVSPYEAVPSPTRSAIFDAGKISRINVADFMARLLTEDPVWREWTGQMPVLYSRADSEV